MTRAAAEPLRNLWDDAHAAQLDEPGKLLYRSNLLGSDLRITNFGGGNTSAKVVMPDPLTKQPMSVLWVKGSGGDIGSMKRDGFATLYLDKLEGLKSLYRGLAHEDEMVALVRPLHLQSQSTRDLDRHAPARLRAARPCRPRARRRRDRHRRLKRRRGADETRLWRQARLLTVATPGLRSRPQARRDSEAQSRSDRRRAWRPRALHLGRDRQILLRDDPCRHQSGRRMARRERAAAGVRRSPLRARRCDAPQGDRRATDAADPRQDLRRRAQGRPFHRRAGSPRIRQLERARRTRSARHLLPRPFPAHEDPAARSAL